MHINGEIDWVKVNNIKGALLLTDNGICFQPYDMTDKSPYLLGESASIAQTGVFGALNLYNKLSSNGEADASEVAKSVRDEIGVSQLIEEGVALFFPWGKITDLKNKRFKGCVEIKTETKEKIIIGDPDGRKLIMDVVAPKLKEESKRGR